MHTTATGRPDRWITGNAATLTDLSAFGAMVGDAEVVGIGYSVRHAHELLALGAAMTRHLVIRRGFRSVYLEGDDAAGALLDEHVRTGAHDPRAVLAAARPFLAVHEVLDVVRWVRAYNEANPHDKVRIAHDTTPMPGDPDGVERQLAEKTLAWQRETGHRVVYLGGLAHTAVANTRYVPPDGTARRSGGAHLRAALGAGYRSVGLLFGSGAAKYRFPLPPRDFAESAFRAADEPFLLDLRLPTQPEARTWLHEPAITRLVGPRYESAHNAGYHMAGGSMAAWFDAVGYVPRVSPVHELTAEHPPQ